MRRSLPVITILMVILCIPGPVHSTGDTGSDSASAPVDDTVVNGFWRIDYLVLDPDEKLVPVSVKTVGYEQTVRRIHRGYRITVTSHIDPIIIDTGFNAEERIPAAGDLIEPDLAGALQKIQTTGEAVRTVLGWLDETVVYANPSGESQDPETVLARKTANCVGRSQLTATILTRMGIPSRTIRGCLVSRDGETRFHRWIEIEYPGIGALPSDPGATQDFVTPYHLILLPAETADPDAATLSELGVGIEIQREERMFWPVDRSPIPGGFTRVLDRRMTSRERYHSALTVDVSTDPPAVSRMTIQGYGHSGTVTSDAFGRFSLLPIAPGDYDLLITVPGYRATHRKVRVGLRERVHIHCIMEKSGLEETS